METVTTWASWRRGLGKELQRYQDHAGQEPSDLSAQSAGSLPRGLGRTESGSTSLCHSLPWEGDRGREGWEEEWAAPHHLALPHLVHSQPWSSGGLEVLWPPPQHSFPDPCVNPRHHKADISIYK